MSAPIAAANAARSGSAVTVATSSPSAASCSCSVMCSSSLDEPQAWQIGREASFRGLKRVLFDDSPCLGHEREPLGRAVLPEKLGVALKRGNDRQGVLNR